MLFRSVVTWDSYLVFMAKTGNVGLSIEQSEALLLRLPELIAEQKRLLLDKTNTDLNENMSVFLHAAPDTVS